MLSTVLIGHSKEIRYRKKLHGIVSPSQLSIKQAMPKSSAPLVSDWSLRMDISDTLPRNVHDELLCPPGNQLRSFVQLLRVYHAICNKINVCELNLTLK